MSRHMFRKIPRPEAGEFPAYASMYIDLVPDRPPVLQIMMQNYGIVRAYIESMPPEKLRIPHAEGEWTVMEILQHIIDDERIYAYRALRFAREDQTELPGFEQNDYIAPSRANKRGLDDLFLEYNAVRHATVFLFNSFDDNVLMQSGVADGNRATVRALAYHTAGHELHHLNSIKENYG